MPVTDEPVLQQSSADRERLAERIARRMDGPVTALGVLFLLVVLADPLVDPESGLGRVLAVLGWFLWGVFVVEFCTRLVIAPSTKAFLRRNWWQIVFLALPFLRFVRILARLRVLRAGRLFSSAIRSTRTARARLSGRLAWLGVLTSIVILAASQLLYEFASYSSYGDALHDAALATITGEPVGKEEGVAQVLEIVLALYSVVVFAALAGVLGAYLFERRSK